MLGKWLKKSSRKTWLGATMRVSISEPGEVRRLAVQEKHRADRIVRVPGPKTPSLKLPNVFTLPPAFSSRSCGMPFLFPMYLTNSVVILCSSARTVLLQGVNASVTHGMHIMLTVSASHQGPQNCSVLSTRLSFGCLRHVLRRLGNW